MLELLPNFTFPLLELKVCMNTARVFANSLYPIILVLHLIVFLRVQPLIRHICRNDLFIF